ncbi:MAG: hypothetical protein R6W67_08555 [Bacteroidales bacterium]
MKQIRNYVIVSVLAIITIGAGACRNRSTSEQSQIELDQREMIEQQIEESVYPLPTSADVIKMLTELDVGYIIGISNPVDNAPRYLTSRSRAINLGIYGADLSYATLYNIQQAVINYLNAIRILANELNMSQIYDEALYNEIRDNFDNRDELVNILTDAFNNTFTFLNNNNQESLAMLVVGGAWLEGMYITTNISESVYHVEGIVRVLLEQKKSFELYLEIVKPYEDDPLLSEFVRELKPIEEIYAGITTSLSLDNVEDLTKAIAEVRDKLIF